MNRLTFLFLTSFLIYSSCKPEEESVFIRRSDSMIGNMLNNRSNAFMGCYEVNSSEIDVEIWGANVFAINQSYRLYVNNTDEPVLSGILPSYGNRHKGRVKLEFKGYNSLILYWPKENVVDPIEAFIAIDGHQIQVRYDKSRNGYVDVVWDEYLTCEPVDGQSSVMFWTNFDPMCGFFSIDFGSGESQTMTRYYSNAPGCGATGCATFGNLKKGSYNYKVNCGTLEYMEGNVEVSGNVDCKKISVF